MKKVIFMFFAGLFFIVPLILWPFTSEVFEFNKMVVVYIFTVFIAFAWAARSTIERKFIFRRTILDKPLMIFLGSQLIATLLSIDPLTSWLGYYSRFNGGLMSTVSYLLLYWAFVSNLDRKDLLKLINYSLFPSAVLVSLYGVAEHFGIDKNLWVQDVQKRVFSTLGQPNWLAAWLVALIPTSWALAITNSVKTRKFWIYFSLSVLLFWTFLFTRSRSGLLGFAVAAVTFWGVYFWKNRSEFQNHLSGFGVIGLSLVVMCLITGTQYSPSFYSLVNRSTNQQIVQITGPALETGGTESGTIRRIVWKGALDIWAHYPVFGTGVETFAFSYYQFRPVEHNLVSEWDFIYNKAHNEFLNMAANSGTVGLLSYILLIVFSIYQLFKIKDDPKLRNLGIAFLAGYVSISVTNFFGFSVVPTQIEFFLLPAFAIVLGLEHKEQISEKYKVGNSEKFLLSLFLITAFYLLFLISRYWLADTYYAKGQAYNNAKKPDSAARYLVKAIRLEPTQALYHSEISSSYASLAVSENQKKNTEQVKYFSDLAISESNNALTLSSANLNIKRVRFGVFIMLSAIDANYMIIARDTLIEAIKQAPTDARLHYNLGLIYARTGKPDMAISTLKETIELKANYKEARLAYAILLIDKKQNNEAREQLEYILKYIDPNDALTKQTLEGIK